MRARFTPNSQPAISCCSRRACISEYLTCTQAAGSWPLNSGSVMRIKGVPLRFCSYVSSSVVPVGRTAMSFPSNTLPIRSVCLAATIMPSGSMISMSRISGSSRYWGHGLLNAKEVVNDNCRTHDRECACEGCRTSFRFLLNECALPNDEKAGYYHRQDQDEAGEAEEEPELQAMTPSFPQPIEPRERPEHHRSRISLVHGWIIREIRV